MCQPQKGTGHMMDQRDKRNRFDHEVFSYRATKDGKVFLFWQGKQVKVLRGQVAQKFLRDVVVVGLQEAQLMMAKITGNFKRGNTRS